MTKIKNFISFILVFAFCNCSFAQADTTFMGKEFWVGYGHHQFMENGTNTQEMTLFISTDSVAATVTVEIDSSGNTTQPTTLWKRVYNIPAFTIISTATTSATSYNVAAGAIGTMPKYGAYDARLFSDFPPAGTGGAGLFRKKGIHITSDVPVGVISYIYGSTSSGGTTLLPVEAWGTDYISVNNKQTYASNCYSWTYIVAKENNTVFQIIPSVPTIYQNYTGLSMNVAKTITLQKGQIYQIIGANDGADMNGNGGLSSSSKELTGTVIKSIPNNLGETKPIAVFSGSSRTSNPLSCGSGGGDNDMTQIFPVQMWGTQYLTTPFVGSTLPVSFGTSLYKITVADSTTQVYKNGLLLTGLKLGKYYEYESNTPDYITANKPVQIVQAMSGGSCLGNGGLGDPDKVVLNPLEQSIKRSLFFKNALENITVKYLSLVVPSSALSSLKIDGLNSYDSAFTHPNRSGYSIIIKKWTSESGQSIVSCDSPFVALTYGLGAVESYIFNVNMKAKAINNFNLTSLVALPVSILDFSVSKSNNSRSVIWSASNEVNVKEYQIEYSTNGIDFGNVGSLLAYNKSKADYSFIYNNSNTKSGEEYYRLKIVDKDGKFQYSKIVMLKNVIKGELQVWVKPNPFVEKVVVEILTDKPTKAKIILTDISGIILKTTEQILTTEDNFIALNDLANLSAGFYLLSVEVNSEKKVFKLMK